LGITAVAVESGTYYADAGDRLEIVSADVAAKYPDATFYCEIDGILVRETNNGSDASKKLMAGDTITHVNKIQVLSVADVAAIINDLYGGDTIEITFVRGGKTMVTNIQLSEAEIQ
jgi:S1-C subfamily serine protease